MYIRGSRKFRRPRFVSSILSFWRVSVRSASILVWNSDVRCNCLDKFHNVLKQEYGASGRAGAMEVTNKINTCFDMRIPSLSSLPMFCRVFLSHYTHQLIYNTVITFKFINCKMIEISVKEFNKYRLPTAYVKISTLIWKVQLLSTSFTVLFRLQNRVEITKVHFRLSPTSS